MLSHIKIPQRKVFLDYSRHELPQIPSNKFSHYVDWLQNKGIEIEKKEVDPKRLKATQDEFDKEKIAALMKKPELKPTISSRDGFVLDGHHRWLADYNNKKLHNTQKVQLPIKTLIDRTHSYDHSFTKKIHETEIRANLIRKAISESRA